MEDQTALSLEECLRLLEATFPFGENSEVSLHGDGNKFLLFAGRWDRWSTAVWWLFPQFRHTLVH